MCVPLFSPVSRKPVLKACSLLQGMPLTALQAAQQESGVCLVPSPRALVVAMQRMFEMEFPRHAHRAHFVYTADKVVPCDACDPLALRCRHLCNVSRLRSSAPSVSARCRLSFRAP